MSRQASIERKTGETKIAVSLVLDGSGKSAVSTGIGFFDHMLALFAKHGLFDLEIKAEGDLEVDIHHTVEDTGIALGQAFDKALADRSGIKRVGSVFMPMDDTLVACHIDICGRPTLVYRDFIDGPIGAQCFNASIFRDFFVAFTNQLKAAVHLVHHYGPATKDSELHHLYEAAFKAFARALDHATSNDPRQQGVPSTKGTI